MPEITEEILKRLELLEAENKALRNEVNALKDSDYEVKQELDTINHFISAITASRSTPEIMSQTELTAKELTGSDEAVFYLKDNATDKFFAENNGRQWQNAEKNESLKKVFENQNIQSEKNKALIPIIAGDGKSLGVIEVKKQSDFIPSDFEKMKKGGIFSENIKLGLMKEYEHQGRITDELTKIFNRQGLNEYLENTVVKAHSEGKSVNILMCDIDHFKSVNDTYGHDAGDVILKATADVLKDFTKSGADCAFRMGGEEMIAVIISDSPTEAIEKAEELRQKIESTESEITKFGEKINLGVTVSIGVHEISPDVNITKENARQVFDEEFENADYAVYQAKETGRNKVVSADKEIYASYLADKAANILTKSARLEEDLNAKNMLESKIKEAFLNPTKEQNPSTISQAIRLSVQDDSIVNDIAGKIDEFSSFFDRSDETEEISEEIDLTEADHNNSNDFDYELFDEAYDNSEELKAEKFEDKMSAMNTWSQKVTEKIKETLEQEKHEEER